ncbi:MAG: copper amine oxidase N-terminal domain-containing protein [Bacillota bacterium]
MKKWFAMVVMSIIAVAMLAVAAPLKQAEAALTNVSVEINDVSVQFPDQGAVLDIKINRVYVPVRFVSETLGAKVDWDAKTQVVTITMGDKKIKVEVSKTIIEGKGFILNKRTMVPIRFVSEALGAKVDWDNKKRVVKIYKDGIVVPEPPVVEYKVIDGYKVPVVTDIMFRTSTIPSHYPASMGINHIKPLEKQYSDVHFIISSKFGTEVATQVVDYAKLKTDVYYNLPHKYFKIPNHNFVIEVGAPWGWYNVNIVVKTLDHYNKLYGGK